MIKIKKIHIQKFRGIIDLEIVFDDKNFTICGPNGTGKSGVIDAIEFVLSGDISRLSGTGRGDVSIKKHAPHVDYRNKPDEASVTLTGTIVSSEEAFEISRNVGSIQSPKILPQSETILSTLDQLSSRKNISLSRRELIQYIISEKSVRASQINALLQLDQLSKLRGTFQKIFNSQDNLRKTSADQKRTAAEQLAQSLDIPTLKSSDLLVAVNERRKILALPELLKLEATTSLVDGLATIPKEEAQKVFDKKTAENDIKKLQVELEVFLSEGIQELLMALDVSIKEFSKNEMSWKDVSKQSLLSEALNQLDDTKCPVCETEWEIAKLADLIKTKIAKLESAISGKSKLLSDLNPIIAAVKKIVQASKSIQHYGEILEPKCKTDVFLSKAEELEKYITPIEEFKSESSIVDALSCLTDCVQSLVIPSDDLLVNVQKIEEKPDPLSARDFLTVANERLDFLRKMSRELQKNEATAKIAKDVFDCYNETYEDGLNGIYLDVQEEFAEFYKSVNADDESGFTAILEVSKSALDLNVDFYGKGKFPPSAYHSEGHQDGMGLCLYLALMKHLYADEFQICVLDDVLMSVDSSHRRDVCKLIQTEFPNTQFIFTTHDEVWLKNMQTTGIIEPKNFLRFRKWDVDTGPHEWDGRDVWKEVLEKIENNEISSAAHTLRYFLEFFFGEICNNLEASVVYRGDNQHALGDLLPHGCNRLKKLLKDSVKVSKHWGKDEEAAKVEVIIEKLTTAISSTDAEKWSVNPNVHYNEWANFQKSDFAPVAESFKELCDIFSCPNCSSLLRISKNGNKKDALKCSCGTQNYNLNDGK